MAGQGYHFSPSICFGMSGRSLLTNKLAHGRMKGKPVLQRM